MERIQRSVMLLRGDAPQNGRATLKLLAQTEGTAIDLLAQSLPAESLRLYLFDKKGSEHDAGEISDGHLKTMMASLSLQEIAGAAVVAERNSAFVLKSSGMDFTDVITRFKIARIAKQTVKSAPEEAAGQEVIYASTAEIKTPVIPDTEEESAQPAAMEPGPTCSTCPHVIRQDKINPFPFAFPESEWVRISYPGPAGWWHYISGKIFRGETVIAKVLGVPGEYGMAPPIWLEGFGTYMRCASPDAHGYWLMFQDAQTGEVLDMGLSPHDG